MLTPITLEEDPMKTLWRTSPALTATALLMLPVLFVSLAGLVLDDRSITGAPAWLKPAKFAASIAIFSLTLAWVFRYLPDWRRTRRLAGGLTAGAFVIEMTVIALQAFRGTTSHFNVATPFDTTLWILMGSAIAVQTFASVVVVVALFRQSFTDRALGWALRLGLALAILGASTGGLMTRPTEAQLDEARERGTMEIAGAHTVGAPDGGPGLPGTGWSLSHGDLRVPHFLGLHAFQLLPLIAIALAHLGVRSATRFSLTIVATLSYASLFGILLWQALRAESVAQPAGPVAAALVLWASGTVLLLIAAASRREAIHVAS
jgi:hypothetical protein